MSWMISSIAVPSSPEPACPESTVRHGDVTPLPQVGGRSPVPWLVAAVVTPPDVVSQLILAVPLVLLYEVGLFAARFFVPKGEAGLPVKVD